MDLSKLIDKYDLINADLLIFCLTALIGFISWLIKGLIEIPLLTAKETYNRIVEKRLDILVEVKTRILYLMYFPSDQSSKSIKEDLRQIVLKDGKVAYLDQIMLANLIRISIDVNTNHKLVLETYKLIEDAMSKHVEQAAQEMNFYSKFSKVSPIKRTGALLILGIINLLVIVVCATGLVLAVFWFVTGSLYIKIFISITCIIVLYILSAALKINR
jgi:hypothetical protein